ITPRSRRRSHDTSANRIVDLADLLQTQRADVLPEDPIDDVQRALTESGFYLAQLVALVLVQPGRLLDGLEHLLQLHRFRYREHAFADALPIGRRRLLVVEVLRDTAALSFAKIGSSQASITFLKLSAVELHAFLLRLTADLVSADAAFPQSPTHSFGIFFLEMRQESGWLYWPAR